MNQHLVLLDFDGTMVDTFKDSPNGWNVENASQYAIGRVFGDRGTVAFKERGGLRSGEPGEIVADISSRLGLNTDLIRQLTQDFVDAKLEVLTPEISPEWPSVYPGVRGFVAAASEGRIPVDIGVLSSGHDGFITKVFEINGLAPKFLITSDLLRERAMPQRPRYKPHPYQLAEAHRQWLVQRAILPRYDNGNGREQFVGRALGKQNMLYIGDDPVKDGGLALEARIPFVHVPFRKPDFVPDAEKGQMSVPDFNELLVRLDWNKWALYEGVSFAQVLFGKADTELFPPVPDGEVYRKILGERSFG